jgi:hypothetical protein
MRRRAVAPCGVLKRFLVRSGSIALLAGAAMLLGLSAQTPATQPPAAPQWQIDAGGKASFEVTSVKQNVSHNPANSNVALTNLDEGAPNGGFLSAVGFSLARYITFAYKLSPGEAQVVISQLPKWAVGDRFDIEARANGSPTRDQMRLMMQALLAGRFKLAVHTETHQLPVLAAVLGETRKARTPTNSVVRRRAMCDQLAASPWRGAAPAEI